MYTYYILRGTAVQQYTQNVYAVCTYTAEYRYIVQASIFAGIFYFDSRWETLKIVHWTVLFLELYGHRREVNIWISL